MESQAKSSPAVKIWLGILAGVLLVLFLETNVRRAAQLNLIINADADDIGAEVLIDNQKVGTISSSDGSGPGGGVYLGYLNCGKHVVEVRKEGFKPFHKDIDMQLEQYLGVDLERLNN